jgi:redox-sensitive bicupin YhaK (pirin superfamily)
VHLLKDAELQLPVPETHNAFIYVYDGAVGIANEEVSSVSSGEIALLGPGNSLSVVSDQDSRFILVAGRPLHEPVARQGPFVMNTDAEVRQAFIDYQSGRF